MSDRAESYRAILKRFSINPEDTSYSGAEDAAELLSGEREMCRYCLVTSAGDFFYAYAYDGTLEAAKKRAFESIDDPLFAESPITIIDLDTGEEWKPDYTTVQWDKVEEEKPKIRCHCDKCGWQFLILTEVPNTEAYKNTTWFCPHCGSDKQRAI